ncbi:hypothetical protein CMI47_17870 [Candidatus Pacearchaeota archaeon]|nr:hypothetical protein [Candidatus Pacearchaeota archaeon]
MRSADGWSRRVGVDQVFVRPTVDQERSLQDHLDDLTEIPWQALPLVPWLANRLRKGGDKNPPIELFYSVLTELDLTDAERRKLERIWRPYEESLNWVVPEEGRVATGPTAARKLELSFMPQTARVLGWDRVNKIRARASIQGLNRHSLSDMGDWVRSQNPDMGRLSIGEALTGSRIWHDDLALGKSPPLGSRDQGQVVVRLPKRWTWQRLGADLLEAEGNAMGHCIGGDSYVHMAERGEASFYSLRDAKGQPHITVEVSTISQEVLDRLDTEWGDAFQHDDDYTYLTLDPSKPEELAEIKGLKGYESFLREWGDEEEALTYLQHMHDEGHWSGEGRFVPPGDHTGLWQDSIASLSGRENARPHKKYSSAITSLVELLAKAKPGHWRREGLLADAGAAESYLTVKDKVRLFGRAQTKGR